MPWGRRRFPMGLKVSWTSISTDLHTNPMNSVSLTAKKLVEDENFSKIQDQLGGELGGVFKKGGAGGQLGSLLSKGL